MDWNDWMGIVAGVCIIVGFGLMCWAAVKHHEAVHRARRKRYSVKEPS